MDNTAIGSTTDTQVTLPADKVKVPVTLQGVACEVTREGQRIGLYASRQGRFAHIEAEEKIYHGRKPSLWVLPDGADSVNHLETTAGKKAQHMTGMERVLRCVSEAVGQFSFRNCWHKEQQRHLRTAFSQLGIQCSDAKGEVEVPRLTYGDVKSVAEQAGSPRAK